MAAQRVLIVEDEILVAMDVEAALRQAGYEVSGIATSEAEAVAMAKGIHPDLAIVDVRLAPGDGRVVARELANRFNTTILMATSDPADSLDGIGASALLPKPYPAALVPAALEVAEGLAAGIDPVTLPDHMRRLRRD